jgi:anti-sigma B factor antagonist
MEIIVEIDNSVIILKPIGRLDANNVKSLQAQVAKLTEKNYIYILLDLSRVDFIDSMGLGACIGLYKTLNSRGGALVCTGSNETIRAIFRLTRADEKITLANSRLEALNILQDKAMRRCATV